MRRGMGSPAVAGPLGEVFLATAPPCAQAEAASAAHTTTIHFRPLDTPKPPPRPQRGADGRKERADPSTTARSVRTPNPGWARVWPTGRAWKRGPLAFFDEDVLAVREVPGGRCHDGAAADRDRPALPDRAPDVVFGHEVHGRAGGRGRSRRGGGGSGRGRRGRSGTPHAFGHEGRHSRGEIRGDAGRGRARPPV